MLHLNHGAAGLCMFALDISSTLSIHVTYQYRRSFAYCSMVIYNINIPTEKYYTNNNISTRKLS